MAKGIEKDNQDDLKNTIFAEKRKEIFESLTDEVKKDLKTLLNEVDKISTD